LPCSQVVIFDDTGKEKDICIDLIPPHPIKKKEYICDRRFYVNLIENLYNTYDEYGIVLVEGEYALFYKYSQNECKEIDSVSIYRKNKNRRGGQSSGRFFRIRLQQIDHYIKTLNEMIIRNYINREFGCETIKKLIVAGTGDVKDKLVANKEFPSFLKEFTVLLSISKLDINLVLKHEMFNIGITIKIKELDEFYDSLNKGISNIVYGEKETAFCLENGYIKHLIIHEKHNSDILKNARYAKKVNVILTNDKLFESYGGIGAILWFPLDDSVFNMIEQ